MMSVELGCVGFCQLSRMHGRDHGFTIVFIQTWPAQRRQYRLGACTDGGMGLNLPLQGARQGSFKLNTLLGEVFSESLALLLAECAELVIILRAK